MVIRHPRRPNRASHPDRGRNHRRYNPAGAPARRTPKKIRIAFDPEMSPFDDDPNYKMLSPESPFIEIDSADEIAQEYTVPSTAGSHGQHTLPKYFVDPVNKILVVYYFNHQDNTWMRQVTRLRSDLHIPQPPVGQHTHNAQVVLGSRGTRYQRERANVKRVSRRRVISNRIYRGRSGISGARRGR